MMLVAMTYNGALFASVIFGLTFGHALFNRKSPVTHAEPCCQNEDFAAPPPGGGKGGGGGDGGGEERVSGTFFDDPAAVVRLRVGGMTCNSCRRVVTSRMTSRHIATL